MNKDNKATYEAGGVSIKEGDKAVSLISAIAKKTFTKGVINGIGGFSSLFKIDKNGYDNPVLVSGTDGVGTKLKIAFELDKHDTIGIDLVAMCVNDILTSGADPLFFLDYIATSNLSSTKIASIVQGIAFACKESNMALVGGETAQMPSFYKGDDYDMAGFALGIVDFNKLIDGSTIKSGDSILGIPSSGFHSNGYSLIRHVLFSLNNFKLSDSYDEDRSIADILLEPTRIYYKEIDKLKNSNIRLKGLAHITGGGLKANIMRIIPKGLSIKVYQRSLPSLFKWIEAIGSISFSEMEKTFNLGIGMALVVPDSDRERVIKLIGEKDIIDVGMVI